MTVTELKALGAIYFENILNGMDRYEHRTMKLSAAEVYEELQSDKDSFADFYYWKLTKESQDKIDSLLTVEEKVYVSRLNRDPEEYIYPIEPMLLQIITKLNEQEMLFSTIYRITNQETWWGNYGQEYIIFTKERS